jgi:hypothetical protein
LCSVWQGDLFSVWHECGPGDVEELLMGMQKAPVVPAFSKADQKIFARPTSTTTTKMLWIAVLGLVAYFWMAIVLVSAEKEEDPVRCCGNCVPGSGDPTAIGMYSGPQSTVSGAARG